ncbi:hypothetical protein PCASD_20244 [Puccinia coronata f. sp. avenae]|uniref:cAMP-independent regulatory protein pac2 n=1 Tax=Puccinia coronata f. sp. avenae TaxID=200324 RepID=A0A2N5TS00_9BASI|nr:hypothetical protein PCASD_20244 [Puccinia coronata f. sp. avenae]
MHDRRDRTSWAYQLPPNLAPPIPYAESSGVQAFPPSSSHVLSSPIVEALIPSHHYHYSQQRLSINPTHSTNSRSSFRCASSNPDYRSDQESVNQQARHHQEQLSRQVASLPASFTMMSETWFGLVQTPRDAYLLLEACRVGMLHRVTRRLTDLERSQVIRPGAVFVWEEKEAGIKRWTDHVRWSPSRVSGAFLIYSELLSATRDSHVHVSDPLLKQSFSSTTLDGERLHLIAYYSKSALDSGQLRTPAVDEHLRSIVVPTGVYPDHRATGGVEDQASRDRQRSSLVPRNSLASFETSRSVPSSNSLESVTSSLDNPHLHPATPTHLSEVSYHHSALLGVSQPHSTRSMLVPRGSAEYKFGNQPDYYSSFYGQSLAPSFSTMTRPALPSDSMPWDTFPTNISSWDASAESSVTSEAVSCPNVTATTPVASVLTSPNPLHMSDLGAWDGEQDIEKAERRIPAAIPHSVASHPSLLASSNTHGYHPYARMPDRERMSKDRRMEAKHRNTRGFSYDPTTAPGTPLDQIYKLPTHQGPISDSPPQSSSNTPPPTTVAAVVEAEQES